MDEPHFGLFQPLEGHGEAGSESARVYISEHKVQGEREGEGEVRQKKMIFIKIWKYFS